MTKGEGREIAPAEGKLGVLLPGMGAVATTFIAGVEAIRTGLSRPIGSLTQMGTVRLGKRTDNRNPRIADFVPLSALDDVVFGGWDIYTDDAYVAAKKAGVLHGEHLARSGILHYHVGEGRFVGPRHDRELTTAALDFLTRAGRLATAAS